MKLDFANAFNAIRRDKTAESINREIPELLPFFKLCYSEDSILSLGDFSLPSSEGRQQGLDNPHRFSSTIHPGLDAIKPRFKQGYLDDISRGDNWRVVLTELRAFIKFATSLGLSLKTNKSELTILGPNTSLSDDIMREFNDVIPSITVTKLSDLEMLGAPIGQEALDSVLNEKLISLNTLCKRIQRCWEHRLAKKRWTRLAYSEMLGAPIGQEALDSVLNEKLISLNTLCKRMEYVDAHEAFYLIKNCVYSETALYSSHRAKVYKVRYPDFFLMKQSDSRYKQY